MASGNVNKDILKNLFIYIDYQIIGCQRLILNNNPTENETIFITNDKNNMRLKACFNEKVNNNPSTNTTKNSRNIIFETVIKELSNHKT